MVVITVDNHSGAHNERVKEKKQGESFKPTAHLETISFHHVLLFYQHPWWQKPHQPTSIRKNCLDAYYVSVAQSLPTENPYNAPNLLSGYVMPLEGKKKMYNWNISHGDSSWDDQSAQIMLAISQASKILHLGNRNI